MLKEFFTVVKKVFTPHTIIFVFLVVLSAVAVPLSFTKFFRDTAFVYISYILSAYTLIVICFRVPAMIIKIYNIAMGNKLIYKYFNDLHFKVFVSLLGSFSINFLYAVFKLVYSAMTGAFWFGAVSIYYILLCVVRFYLIKKLPENNAVGSYYTEMKTYRVTGVFLLGLNMTLSVMIFEVVRDADWSHYRGFMIYVVAGYTFYCLVMAIVNLIKFRRMNSPVLSAAKCINLTTALVSLFSLQTAMFSRFGNNAEMEYILNTITGTLVCIFALLIAVYMCTRSTKILKRKYR